MPENQEEKPMSETPMEYNEGHTVSGYGRGELTVEEKARRYDDLVRRDTCLARVAEVPDEPIFVLRAQDQFAPAVVRVWGDIVVSAAQCQAHKQKAIAGWERAQEIETWQGFNSPRVKIPD